ncbi:MAG: hypothetical protein KDD34_00510 [Bdellovibrionales bacterium]|nr:hypothetical protein [Bdellovibrionales bacterium]
MHSKIKLFLLALISSFLVFGFLIYPEKSFSEKSSWILKKSGNTYVFLRKKKEYSFEHSNSIIPKIQKVITHGHFEIVVYLHDISGTFAMTEVYTGAIFDKTTNKIVGFETYSYKNISDKKVSTEQPKWTLNPNGSIEVFNPESGFSEKYQ